MKVLITGGSGFIGSYLSVYLKERGIEVAAPSSGELDVLCQEDWDGWNGKDIGHVIHLAGKTFVPDSWDNPVEFFKVNAMGTLNAIRFCRAQNAGMTYVSAYIYGQPESNPIAETAKAVPNNPYAGSKYAAEEMCAFFGKYFEMNITVLRLFNVFGPGQKEHFLIPFLIKQIRDSKNTVSVQDLTPKRDYIYIEDVCKAIELSIHKTNGYQLFNIGSGRSFSVGEVIEMLQRISGTEKQVFCKNSVRKNELNDVIADISLIRSEWGWTPEVDLLSGLAKTMEAEHD